MSKVCSLSPEDKQDYIKDIGKILVDDYGKRDFYSPEEVEKSHKKSKWWSDNNDYSCWAMSIFSSHDDFDVFHEKIGESCDYAFMKTEMLKGLSMTSFNIDDLELTSLEIDSSWLDFGDIFSGIGEVIAGIFDGL